MNEFIVKDDRENPSVILFVLYFLAQHWDMLKDYEKSLCLIDQAIDHTPTLLELLMFKARTLKVWLIVLSNMNYFFITLACW